MKKITLIIVIAFLILISFYEINFHYSNPVMVTKNLPKFPTLSDFTLHSTNTNVVRIHIIDVSQPSDVLISRARRAVVERKVGVIYFKGDYKDSLLAKTKNTLKKIGFKIGTPKPFKIPKYLNIISAVLLVLFLAFFIDKKFLFLLILPIIDFKINVSIYLIYLVALIVPVIYLPKNKRSYFVSFLFVILFGSLSHFLFFQTRYVVGAAYPRGIKLVLLLPFFYLIYKYRIKIEKKDVRLLILLIILGIIYIVKSGNYIEPTIFERRVRDWMDTIFYVRPRFKELLIGFPLLWIMAKYGLKNKFAILLSLLAYTSVIDSFLHPYTDAFISAYRSAISLTLGIFIGELYYKVYNVGKRVFKWTE